VLNVTYALAGDGNERNDELRLIELVYELDRQSKYPYGYLLVG